MKDKKSSIIVITLVVLAVVMVIGVSYALWQITLKQETTNRITTGCFNIEFKDKNNIELLDAVPITDKAGKSLVPYEFTITNTCKTYAGYEVNLEIEKDSTLTNLEYIDVMLNESEIESITKKEEVMPTIETASKAYKLDTGRLNGNEERTFYLRMWLDEETPTVEEVMNKTLNSKITITLTHDKIYNEAGLNGADPVLREELVPVTIANNGDVTKANVEEEWYNYKEKQWANAVILKDKSVPYMVGATIPEDNIESYFVWIPRYRYKIFNDEKYSGLTNVDNTKVQRIEVEFESKYVTPSTGNKKGEWLTHPAFTSFDSNGMWVGKFETSKSNQAPDNSINYVGVQIKPNVVSWRNIQVGNAFYTSYAYQRNLDSHMMKNSEWGAVAYLQHSKYGSETSVRNNNNSSFITGYASVKEPTCGWTDDNRECNKYGTTADVTLPYNTETGYLASTTGNISGIYDMSGGAWEYVMGVMTDQSGNLLSGQNASNNSGFVGGYGESGSLVSGYSWPEEKYYDKYAYGTSPSEYTRGHFGDATFEMGPFKSLIYANNLTRQISSWYTDQAYFSTNVQPWFSRGGACDHGTDSGQFTFSRHTGSVSENIGFRVVLTP